MAWSASVCKQTDTERPGPQQYPSLISSVIVTFPLLSQRWPMWTLNAGGLRYPPHLHTRTLPLQQLFRAPQSQDPRGGPTPPPALPVPRPVHLLPALRGLRGDSICLKRTVFNTPFTQVDVADGFYKLFHHEHTTRSFYSSLHKQSELCNCRFFSVYNFKLKN